MSGLREFFEERPHESGGSVTPEQVASIQRQHRDASEGGHQHTNGALRFVGLHEHDEHSHHLHTARGVVFGDKEALERMWRRSL